MESLDEHRDRIARDGYTILERVIEPELIAALAHDLQRLEEELEIKPARNPFEGTRTVRDLQSARARSPLRADPRARGRAAARRGACSIRAAWCRRCRRSASTPTSARSRSMPTTSSCRCRSRTSPTRMQHDVGAHRLHRGERRHARHPGIAPARPLADVREALRQRRGRDARVAACSCGTAASGMAAAPTAPGSAASASR